MKNEFEEMAKAFPSSLESIVISISEKIRLHTNIKSVPGIYVILNGEEIKIPYRIYFDEHDDSKLSEVEKKVLRCYFTRHKNGFTREIYLKEIIKFDDYFITPYVVQLVGEYVSQNMEVIYENLREPLLQNIQQFKAENEIFYKKTVARVNSYWDVYYKREEYPNWNEYPGNKILKKINRFMNEGKSD